VRVVDGFVIATTVPVASAGIAVVVLLAAMET
jgi:hypothetical protein